MEARFAALESRVAALEAAARAGTVASSPAARTKIIVVTSFVDSMQTLARVAQARGDAEVLVADRVATFSAMTAEERVRRFRKRIDDGYLIVLHVYPAGARLGAEDIDVVQEFFRSVGRNHGIAMFTWRALPTFHDMQEYKAKLGFTDDNHIVHAALGAVTLVSIAMDRPDFVLSELITKAAVLRQ